uniref:D_3_633 n=1 Tax=synthetic construct TaxID=32630 RepID=UPI002016A777|nr:Chain A, D_3_633 [synthetic construct]7RKC_B Chain B, D_3_633 [synthetic construct]
SGSGSPELDELWKRVKKLVTELLEQAERAGDPEEIFKLLEVAQQLLWLAEMFLRLAAIQEKATDPEIQELAERVLRLIKRLLEEAERAGDPRRIKELVEVALALAKLLEMFYRLKEIQERATDPEIQELAERVLRLIKKLLKAAEEAGDPRKIYKLVFVALVLLHLLQTFYRLKEIQEKATDPEIQRKAQEVLEKIKRLLEAAERAGDPAKILLYVIRAQLLAMELKFAYRKR